MKVYYRLKRRIGKVLRLWGILPPLPLTDSQKELTPGLALRRARAIELGIVDE